MQTRAPEPMWMIRGRQVGALRIGLHKARASRPVERWLAIVPAVTNDAAFPQLFLEPANRRFSEGAFHVSQQLSKYGTPLFKGKAVLRKGSINLVILEERLDVCVWNDCAASPLASRHNHLWRIE